MPSYFIENPERNIDRNLFSFSTDNKQILFPRLKNALLSQQINPDEYPKAIDFGSGDGGVAAFLVQLGWQSNNITCVDKLIAPYPAVNEVVWQYIDLDVLALELIRQGINNLDQRISDLQGSFDLITCNCVFLDENHIAALAGFFLRPNGVAIIDGITKRREELISLNNE